MTFRDSKLAHELLDGLKNGLEIGPAAHNPFNLRCDVRTVDKFHHDSPEYLPYKREQERLCGTFSRVDIVAPGDALPLPDKSVDFIISSHVIEHFFDPIKALKEWARVARKYIYIICPQPDALESDRQKLITGLPELLARHAGDTPAKDTDEHHTRWTCDTFRDMCAALGFHVSHWQERDDKVGNGFTVVIDLQPIILQVNPDLEPKGIVSPVKKGKK